MKSNKTGWTITLTALLLIVGGGIIVKLWPRTVPINQCSPIYREYMEQEGLNVSFVRKYKVNDTTFVDATLITATNDSAWVKLCHDFLIFDDLDCYDETKIHGESVFFFLVSREDHHVRIAMPFSGELDYVVLSPAISAICIFHVESVQQILPIIAKETHRLKTTEK